MKLGLFEQIVELNQLFDRLVVAWKDSSPFHSSNEISFDMLVPTLRLPVYMPTGNSSTTLKLSSRTMPSGPTNFSATSTKN